MAINLDKATQLYEQSLKEKVPKFTVPETVIGRQNGLGYNHAKHQVFGEQKCYDMYNPSLAHRGKIPFSGKFKLVYDMICSSTIRVWG